ncbi:MAG: RNB domain-containing ribonuclease [Phycisphaerales bacterium]
MLPEVLERDLLVAGRCRLRQDRDHMLRQAGQARQRGVCSLLIKSTSCMTYLEAQRSSTATPRGEKHAKTEPVYTDKLIATVKEMDTLARAIRDAAQGMIHLELPDVELIFDEDGHVVDAEPEDDAFTHTIIEMFMVEANECLGEPVRGPGRPVVAPWHPPRAHAWRDRTSMRRPRRGVQDPRTRRAKSSRRAARRCGTAASARSTWPLSSARSPKPSTHPRSSGTLALASSRLRPLHQPHPGAT